MDAVLFDLDDTLYDNTLQVSQARRNAVNAMISAGLDGGEVELLTLLDSIVSTYGSNFQGHFNELLISLGKKPDPKVVAAGIIAYHETKKAYLNPHVDALPTLLKLRESGFKIGVVTDGVPVKQWEKLLRLGLGDFFHTVVVAEIPAQQKPNPTPFMKACENLGVKPVDCAFIGDRLDKDILGANLVGMASIRILRGRFKDDKPKIKDETPKYEIKKLSEIINIVKN